MSICAAVEPGPGEEWEGEKRSEECDATAGLGLEREWAQPPHRHVIA